MKRVPLETLPKHWIPKRHRPMVGYSSHVKPQKQTEHLPTNSPGDKKSKLKISRVQDKRGRRLSRPQRTK